MWISLNDLQQLIATVPAEHRRGCWSWLIRHARAQEQEQMLSEREGVADSWDACMRILIEEEATSLQQLLQGLVVSSVVPGASCDAYTEAVAMLRRCQEWIATEPDNSRQAPLLQYLADHLVQVLGHLHYWLVIEEAKGLDRAEWFWRGWELLQWRLTFDVPLPSWWSPVQEQVVRIGALAWHERAEGSDPLQLDGQMAITRALCLMQALVPLHSPLPAWIPTLQRQLAEQGLRAQLQCDPLSDEALQQVLTWLELLQPANTVRTAAVGRKQGMIQLRDQLADLDLSELLPDAMRRHLEEQKAIVQAGQLLQQGEWQQARQLLDNLTDSSQVKEGDLLRVGTKQLTRKPEMAPNTSNAVILIAGMRHSGSTALFNIVRLAFEQAGIIAESAYSENLSSNPIKIQKNVRHIIKIHEFRDDLLALADLIFTTRRDLRDTVASAKRRDFDMLRSSKSIWGYASYNRSLHELWLAYSDYEFIYESFMSDPKDSICQVLDMIGLPSIDWSVIYHDVCNLPLDQYSKTLLSPQHITDPERRLSYRDTLDANEIRQINDRNQSWLSSYGY